MRGFAPVRLTALVCAAALILVLCACREEAPRTAGPDTATIAGAVQRAAARLRVPEPPASAGEAEAAGTGAAVLVESTDGTTTPPAPDEAALRAFADQAGLENLGDWAVPQDSPYPNALYSQNGEALITASVNAYDYSGWTDTAGIVTSPRWFLSLSLQPCTAEELPVLVP